MKAAPLTLEALNKIIKSTLKDQLDSFWVVAEINEITLNFSGHCYLELVQKSEKTEQLVARAKATIWNNIYRMLQPYFETTTGQSLAAGMKIMVRVIVEFHEVYGLSLNIVDIEPTYTVGEISLRRQKILQKLTNEGVIDMNRELLLPYFVNRIAIVSSKTAAGLLDFQNQLHHNPQGYQFYAKVFPAIMQGNEAEGSIINQLERIYQHADLFDVVVIIRGGGAAADLECFNSYWLAYHITQFPLPVLSGIGHEQDDTVTDRVAHTRLKTPTAVAGFLVDKMQEVAQDLAETNENIIDLCQEIIAMHQSLLEQRVRSLQKNYSRVMNLESKTLSKAILHMSTLARKKMFSLEHTLDKSGEQLKNTAYRQLDQHQFAMNSVHSEFKSSLKIILNTEQHHLSMLEKSLLYNNPQYILEKGFTLTLKDGQRVKHADTLKKGDAIETVFADGKKKSIIH